MFYDCNEFTVGFTLTLIVVVTKRPQHKLMHCERVIVLRVLSKVYKLHVTCLAVSTSECRRTSTRVIGEVSVIHTRSTILTRIASARFCYDNQQTNRNKQNSPQAARGGLAMSYRRQQHKGRFPLPEFTGRVDGPKTRVHSLTPVNSGRELG